MRALWCLLVVFQVGLANEVDDCNSKEICAYQGKEKNCRCDRECIKYNDCCIDARERRPGFLASGYVCQDLSPLGGVFVTGMCSASWSGNARIKTACESRSSVSDSSFTHIPVVNIRTGKLFKNYQCAICNNENHYFLKFWKVAITCHTHNQSENATTENYLVKVNVGDESIRCQTVHAPAAYHSLRSCHPGVVEDCPDGGGNSSLAEACHDHLSVKTFGGNVTFRNEYCALCHGVPESSLSCTAPPTPSGPWHPSPFSSLEEFECPRGTSRHLFLSRVFSVRCRTKFFHYFSESATFLNFVYNRFLHFYYTRLKWHDIVLKVKVDGVYIFCEHDNDGVNQTELTFKEDQWGAFGKLYCSMVSLQAEDEVISTDLGLTLPTMNRTYFSTGYVLNSVPDDDHYVISYASFQDLVRPASIMVYVCFLTFILKIYIVLWFALYIISFLFYSKIKSTFDYCTFCLVVTYILLNFLAVVGDPLYVNRSACYHLGLGIYFTYLAYLLWLNVLGYDLMRTVRYATTKLKLPDDKMEWVRFFWYCIYVHGIPSLLILMIVLMDRYLPDDAKYKPHFGLKRCWLGTVHSRLAFSLIPFALVASLTIPFFLVITNMIIKHSRSIRGSALIKKGTVRRRVLLFAKISCLVAISKLLVLIADQFDESDSVFYFKLFFRFADLIVGILMLHFIGHRSMRELWWRASGKYYKDNC